MTPITYLTGDATAPQAIGPRIICHVCNDAGGWGKGFVLAISKRWPAPEAAYRRWYRHQHLSDFGLGAVQMVKVEPSLWVANMVAQHGVGRREGPPIRYGALAQCLHLVGDRAIELSASVHMPRIGCGLAGGEWARVEPLIVEALVSRDVAVVVYDHAPA